MARSSDGTISTRRGNANGWRPLIGRPVIGEWELSLPDTDKARWLFADEKIDDVLPVVTYAGQAPPWDP